MNTPDTPSSDTPIPDSSSTDSTDSTDSADSAEWSSPEWSSTDSDDFEAGSGPEVPLTGALDDPDDTDDTLDIDLDTDLDEGADALGGATTPAALTVDAAHDRERLDHVLTEAGVAPSRSLIRKWIDEGCVTVNGKAITKAGHKLRAGDAVAWDAPALRSHHVLPEDIPLDIVYEDADLIVINKPVGMVVHPGAGHAGGTLVNALLHHCKDLSGVGGVERPGIVHRLDKDTSGLLAVAKHDQAHHELQRQLQAREMKRHYYAIAEQSFKDEQGTIEAPIGRHPVERQRMAVLTTGRFARTHWQVMRRYPGYTWLSLELDTGRTHQIRVHLRHIHRPIVGDELYGSKPKHPFKVERPMLHAYRLSFAHPRTAEPLAFEAPLPPDFARIIEILDARQKL